MDLTPRRPETRHHDPRDLARDAWDRAAAARSASDLDEAHRWLDRAHRVLPDDALVGLTLGALLLELGRLDEAVSKLEPVARIWNSPEAWSALAACHLARGDEAPCIAALEAALRTGPANPGLAARVARRFGRHLEAPDRSAALEGLVECRDGALEGWAWHPADPDRDPLLLLHGNAGSTSLTARDPADDVPGLRPLARPRRVSLSAEEVHALGPPLTVTGADGTPLLGSPLHPDPAPDPPARPPPLQASPPRPVAVVIPIHRGVAETLACLGSVLANSPPGTAVHIVDDASPEPELVAALGEAAARIHLLRHETNRGFPAAANTGLRAAAGHDVVLLNSDTLVPPGWLERLRRAAYAAPDIASATPLSNDATIVSYPAPDAANPVPDAAGAAALDRLAQDANSAATADLPVGVGFCLYLRRDALDAVGLLREDLFAQGYGEETDWCLRARAAGWRHVAALDVFVAHLGARSFGSARTHLQRRNAALLARRHPGHDAAVAAHSAADPLRPARRRIDALRWAEARTPDPTVLLLTHAEGGGVEEAVQSRCAALRAEGVRPIVLRPVDGDCQVEGYPNLRYAIPAELPDLAALLRPGRPRYLESHHLGGHHPAVLGLARLLGIPVDTYVHDYASFCPRIALVGPERHYCGEPDPVVCDACAADPPGATAALRGRSAVGFDGSRRVIAPSRDTAQRLRRHFPGVAVEVRPWEDDTALPDPPPPAGQTARICVVGAIGAEKGYDVLLACADDARRRALPLAFTVCGHTENDTRLLRAGPVFITGRYRPEEAVALIRAQRAHLAFLPSIWPETWCFALSRAWQAGLRAVAFDLGAPAERIRATGRGHLLPLGLPPPAVNDALLRLACARRTPQPALAMADSGPGR